MWYRCNVNLISQHDKVINIAWNVDLETFTFGGSTLDESDNSLICTDRITHTIVKYYFNGSDLNVNLASENYNGVPKEICSDNEWNDLNMLEYCKHITVAYMIEENLKLS